jgi:hypothetical protein
MAMMDGVAKIARTPQTGEDAAQGGQGPVSRRILPLASIFHPDRLVIFVPVG